MRCWPSRGVALLSVLELNQETEYFVNGESLQLCDWEWAVLDSNKLETVFLSAGIFSE